MVTSNEFYSEKFQKDISDPKNQRFSDKQNLFLAENIIIHLCHINNFVGEHGRSLVVYYNFLYKKANKSTNLFNPIIGKMIEYKFFQLIAKILENISYRNLLDFKNSGRDIFIIIAKIIISYGDFSILFREEAINQGVLKVLVNIIKNNKVDEQNKSRTKCVNYVIRAVYNICRLDDYRQLFKEMQIPSILISRIRQITHSSTKVCATLCLGWTLDTDMDYKPSIINLEEGAILSFSLLDRALQAGNNTDENMFRCFLGQRDLLPCFWAYEIVEGIAKLGENKEVRCIISTKNELFNMLIHLYIKSRNDQEKKSACKAISIFSCESNFIEIIRVNSLFRKCLLDDLKNEKLRGALVQINLNIYYTIGVDLEFNLKGLREFELKLLELQIMLENLMMTYSENGDSWYYNTCHKEFLREIVGIIEENAKTEDAKKVLMNLILKKIKKHFEKEQFKRIVYNNEYLNDNSSLYSNRYNDNNNIPYYDKIIPDSFKSKFNQYDPEQAEFKILKEEISFKHMIILCFAILKKGLNSANETSETKLKCFFDESDSKCYLWAYELTDKIGEWCKNELIKEFILQVIQDKLEILINLYNQSLDFIEKNSFCNLILIFSTDSNFLKLLKINRIFCENLIADLNKNNGILNDYLIKISHNLYFSNYSFNFHEHLSLNETENFELKKTMFINTLKNFENRFAKNDYSFLQQIDQIIEEKSKSSKLDLTHNLEFLALETIVTNNVLVEIKEYILDKKSSSNIDLFPLQCYEYYNDNNDDISLDDIFTNQHDMKIIEAVSTGPHCIITKLINMLINFC